MGLDNPLHIAFLVVVLLLVFGAKRLPEIGRSLGGGMREFKDSISGGGSDTAPQQPTLTQATPQPAPVATQQAAEAFGTPPAEQQAPAEPTRQA
jgi:sec-independent protein translocase protein TatA